MVMYLIYDHIGRIYLRVWIVVEVFCHGRIFSLPVSDTCTCIQAMTIHSAINGLPCFANMFLAPPPACSKIHVYYTGGLAGGPYHYFESFSSCMAGESVHGQQYGTGFTPSHPARLVARLRTSTPGDPSDFLDDERQWVVVLEKPFVIIPKYEGMIDVAW